MKQILKLLALILVLSSHFKSIAQSPNVKARQYLQKVMKDEHIPGLAYAVIKNGNLINSGTLGKASIPFDRDVKSTTVFQLASTSKIFSAMLLGKLFDEEILKPEQTLSEFLDSIPEGWKNITILQLASHQSGIRMIDFSGMTSAQIVKEAAKYPLDYEPGTKSFYVSSDYWILLHIIEKTTGLSYFNALKKYVFQPLNLQHTFVSNPKQGMITTMDIIPDQAQEYHWHKEDSTLRISQMLFPSTAYAAGGIYSSINDLIAIAACFDKGNFLSAKTKELISTPVKLKDGRPGSFSLSLQVDENYQGHKLVQHSGGPALADFIRFEKEGYTFIVLTNNRGVYPYLAKGLATFYIPGLKMMELPKGYK
jgi:D-alanyl-D-alanine carboxypeptidase